MLVHGHDLGMVQSDIQSLRDLGLLKLYMSMNMQHLPFQPRDWEFFWEDMLRQKKVRQLLKGVSKLMILLLQKGSQYEKQVVALCI